MNSNQKIFLFHLFYWIIAKHGGSIKNKFAIENIIGNKHTIQTLSLFNDDNKKLDNSLDGSLIEDIETGPMLRYKIHGTFLMNSKLIFIFMILVQKNVQL